MKKKMFVFLTSTLLLTSCSFGHIEDKNGEDDFSIATITEDEIINGSSYMTQGFFSTHILSTINCNAKKFSGVRSIATILLENEEENIIVTNSVSSGNFMIVFVKNNIIEVKAYANSSINIDKTLVNGTYDIKIVGESATFELEIRNI